MHLTRLLLPVLVCILAIWKSVDLMWQAIEKVFNLNLKKSKGKGKRSRSTVIFNDEDSTFCSDGASTNSDQRPTDPVLPNDTSKILQVHVSPSYIWFTTHGECYHTTDNCRGLGLSTTPLQKRRACAFCACRLVVPTYSDIHSKIDTGAMSGNPCESSRGRLRSRASSSGE